MELGYMALLVAGIPKWITNIIERSEIDLATFEQSKGANAAELVASFE